MDAKDSELPALRRHGQNERAMALNRKNALFAGSDEGGNNWAVIATLIENRKIAGTKPHTWLTETLTKLADGHPANSIGDLMPWLDVG